ncbi:MAG: hypothetical protein Q9177_001451 [Variospora cf. flavescens]
MYPVLTCRESMRDPLSQSTFNSRKWYTYLVARTMRRTPNAIRRMRSKNNDWKEIPQYESYNLSTSVRCREVKGLPRCYARNVPLLRPTPRDCASIIDMIGEGDKSSAPMHFSRNADRGFKVPHHWVSSSCVVIIDLVEGKDDTMKLSEIAFTATLISSLCVGRPGLPDLGGSDLAGPRMSMKVVVAGRQKKLTEFARQGNSSVSNGHGTS